MRSGFKPSLAKHPSALRGWVPPAANEREAWRPVILWISNCHMVAVGDKNSGCRAKVVNQPTNRSCGSVFPAVLSSVSMLLSISSQSLARPTRPRQGQAFQFWASCALFHVDSPLGLCLGKHAQLRLPTFTLVCREQVLQHAACLSMLSIISRKLICKQRKWISRAVNLAFFMGTEFTWEDLLIIIGVWGNKERIWQVWCDDNGLDCKTPLLYWHRHSKPSAVAIIWSKGSSCCVIVEHVTWCLVRKNWVAVLGWAVLATFRHSVSISFSLPRDVSTALLP